MADNSLWLFGCCPDYEPVKGVVVLAQAVRSNPRVATNDDPSVNTVSDFTDNMWCRARDEISGTVETVKVHRD